MTQVPASFKLVAELIVERLFDVCNDYVANAAIQNEVLKPWDHFSQLQGGLVMLAKHSPQYAVTALEQWRHAKHRELHSKGPSLVSSKKSLAAMEALVFTSMIQLLDEQLRIHPDSASILRERAFDIILHLERYVGDLNDHRQLLFASCRSMIGALSRLQLVQISKSFQTNVSERLHGNEAAREQVCQLCLGMRNVRMSMMDTQDVTNAITALGCLNPLKTVGSSVSKKSRVQHHICDMLCVILHPLVTDGLPIANKLSISKPVLRQWYAAVQAMMEDVLLWVSKKSKHWRTGYPLASLLMSICIQQPDFETSRFYGFVEKLHKLMKDTMFSDSANRLMGLRCLALCVRAFAHHRSALSDLPAHLGRMLEPPIAAIRKGAITSIPKQLGVLHHFCVECMSYAPQYITNLLLMLLTHESWECVLEGLHAAYDVMTRSATRLSQIPISHLLDDATMDLSDDDMLAASASDSAALSANGGAAAGSSSDSDGLDRALDLIRRGSHPLELYMVADLERLFLEPMGNILQSCWKLHGERSTHKPNNGVDGYSMRVFEEGIRLSPILQPEAWMDESGNKLAEKLAMLTVHSSKSMREQARRTQRNFIQARPKYRNAIVVGMCLLINRVLWSERQHEEISALILQLVQHWGSVLERDAELQETERAAAGAQALDVPTVEGCGLLMISSATSRIRFIGWQLLSEIRRLDRAEPWQATAPEMSNMHVATVLEQTGRDVISKHIWNTGSFSHLMHFKEPPDDLLLLDCLASSDTRRWSTLLPHLLRHVQVLCPTSAQSAYEQVSMHVISMTRQETGAGNKATSVIPTESIGFEQWRLYTIFMAASEPYPNIRRPVGVRSGEDLLTHLCAVLRGGVEVHMQAATAALGTCHPLHLPGLLKNLVDIYPETLGEAPKKSSKLFKRDELRTSIAHIFRATASMLVPEFLHQHRAVAHLYGSFLSMTLQQLASSSVTADEVELKYCVCEVAYALAQEDKRSTGLLSQDLRSRVWRACRQWLGLSADLRGQIENPKLVRLSSAVGSHRAKEGDSRQAINQQASRLAMEALRLTGFLAMAALLSGRRWDETLLKQGTALAWFDAALSSKQAQKSELLGSVPSPSMLAEFPLRDMLLENIEFCGAYLERCYSREPVLSQSYFHVCVGLCVHLHAKGRLSEVWKPYELICLVLHKIVDSNEAVRNDALEVLRCLMDGLLAKDKKRQAAADVAVVIGHLQESYHLFQMELNTKLAQENPELAAKVCREVLTRQMRVEDQTTRQYVLRCVGAWLQHLSLARKWEGTSSGEVLSLVYQMTQKHGQQCPNEVQQLWHTLAATADNAAVIVSFVMQRTMEDITAESNSRLMECLGVSKRILLLCGQQSPQLVVDELMSECAQLINEDEGCTVDENRKLRNIATFHCPLGHTEDSVHSSLDAGKARSGMSRMLSAAAQAELVKLWDSVPGGSPHQSLPAFDSLPASVAMGNGAASALSGGKSVAISVDRSSAKSGLMPISAHERRHTRDTSFCTDDLNLSVPKLPNRADVALCLLSELSHHHDDAFRRHLPILLLVCIIEMDSSHDLVYKHAQQILVNLIYSMAARNLEAHAESGMTEKYQAVAAVVRELQAMGSARLWPAEAVTFMEPQGRTFPVLKRVVMQVVDCMFFEPDLKSAWTEEALNWAMHAPSLAVAQRCMHVTRALSPPLSPSLVHVLLSALLQCHLHPSVTSFDFIAQLLLALLEILRNSQPHEIKMYPQLFWGCLALLQTVHIPIFSLVLTVIDALFNRMQLWNLPCQQILQAGACPPQDDHILPSGILDMEAWVLGSQLFNVPQLSCVQQLLWKGLLHEQTCSSTVRVLTSILRQLASCLSSQHSTSGVTTFQPGKKDTAAGAGTARVAAQGMSHILGRCSYQLVACLISGLPWMLARRHEAHSRQQVARFCNAAAEACMAFGAAEVAPRITAFAAGAPEKALTDWGSLKNLMQNFADPFVHSFFPEHASFVLVFCTRMLLIGPESYQNAYLILLACIYRSQYLDLGDFGSSPEHMSVLRSLVLLIESSHNADVLQLLGIILAHSTARGKSQNSSQSDRDWEAAKLPPELIPLAGESDCCRAVADALQKCVNALKISSNSYSGWSNRSRFLPFLKQE